MTRRVLPGVRISELPAHFRVLESGLQNSLLIQSSDPQRALKENWTSAWCGSSSSRKMDDKMMVLLEAFKKFACVDRTTEVPKLQEGTDPVAPEELNSTTQWSDLHIQLVEEIFRHFYTLQRVKYRRVSPEWNHIIMNEGHALTSVISFSLGDLKILEFMCRRIVVGRRQKSEKTSEQSELASRRNFLSRMFTPYTETLLIDFQWADRVISVPFYEVLCRCPTIQCIVLRRQTFNYDELENNISYSEVLDLLSDGSEIEGCSVILHHCSIERSGPNQKLPTPAVRSIIPTTILRCESEADYDESDSDYFSYRPVLENLLPLLWPYPPDQLKCLVDFLRTVAKLTPKHSLIEKLDCFSGELEDDLYIPETKLSTLSEGKVVVLDGQLVCRLLDCVISLKALDVIAREADKMFRESSSKEFAFPHPFV